MILRAIGRLIMVPLGFLLGSAMALFVLVSLGTERITHAMQGRDLGSVEWGAVFDLSGQVAALASTATIVPALLLVIVGEVARIRSSVYYILGCGAALAAFPLLARTGSLQNGDFSSLGVIWQVFATAGFAGGFVYWLIAGRNA
ncbi:MAG: hypothetical protein ACM31O_20500 [Bacteroidota bacterium]|jgi:hypothetical protein